MVHMLRWSGASCTPRSSLWLPEASHIWSVCVVENSCCVGHSEPQNMAVLRKEFWPPLLVILLCDLRGVLSSTSLGVPIWKMGMLASEGFWVSCVRREVFAPGHMSPVCPSYLHPSPSPVGRSGAGSDAGSHNREFTWVPFLSRAWQLPQGTKL